MLKPERMTYPCRPEKRWTSLSSSKKRMSLVGNPLVHTLLSRVNQAQKHSSDSGAFAYSSLGWSLSHSPGLFLVQLLETCHLMKEITYTLHLPASSSRFVWIYVLRNLILLN